MDVLILRDPRESLAKCSLTPLRGREGLCFVDYRPERRLQAAGRVLLHTEGPLLSPADEGPLLLVDCNWRRVAQLCRTLEGEVRPRRLEGWASAYPRRSKSFPDPGQGLASVEALFAALAELGHLRADLLDTYRWRDAFLAANRARLAELGLDG